MGIKWDAWDLRDCLVQYMKQAIHACPISPSSINDSTLLAARKNMHLIGKNKKMMYICFVYRN